MPAQLTNYPLLLTIALQSNARGALKLLHRAAIVSMTENDLNDESARTAIALQRFLISYKGPTYSAAYPRELEAGTGADSLRAKAKLRAYLDKKALTLKSVHGQLLEIQMTLASGSTPYVWTPTPYEESV